MRYWFYQGERIRMDPTSFTILDSERGKLQANDYADLFNHFPPMYKKEGVFFKVNLLVEVTEEEYRNFK